MATSADVKSTTLQCNCCWNVISSGQCWKTECSHLFCEGCANKYFGRKMQCPLCDSLLNGMEHDTPGLQRMFAHTNDDIVGAVLGYFAFHPEDALRLASISTIFARGQIAIYGTREVWAAGQEADQNKRSLVDTENKLNSVMAELQFKAKEAQDLSAKLHAKAMEKDHLAAAHKSLCRMWEQVHPGQSAAVAIANAQAHDQGKGGQALTRSPIGMLGMQGMPGAAITPMVRRGSHSNQHEVNMTPRPHSSNGFGNQHHGQGLQNFAHGSIHGNGNAGIYGLSTPRIGVISGSGGPQARMAGGGGGVYTGSGHSHERGGTPHSLSRSSTPPGFGQGQNGYNSSSGSQNGSIGMGHHGNKQGLHMSAGPPPPTPAGGVQALVPLANQGAFGNRR